MKKNSRIDKEAFLKALKARGTTQAAVATKIGANPKSFSRWINEGYFQSQHLWDLTETLVLSEEELDTILMIPTYKVFFRKRFLHKVPESLKEKAIELAETIFSLTYLNTRSHFYPPNVSRLQSSIEVADQIRKHTKIKKFNGLPGIISCLAEQGVEIALIPFKKFKLKSEDQEEQAFSLTNENRWLICLDTNSPEERLIFNLCHELCHIFRPDHAPSKMEEKFCNAVATELIYPEKFFSVRKKIIEPITSSQSKEKIINLISAIKHCLGGEFLGIALRLKELEFFSNKNPVHKAIIDYSEDSFNNLQKIEKKLFSDFEPRSQRFVDFWKSSNIESNVLLSLFMRIKNSAIDGSISSRKFTELFDADYATVHEMIHDWRYNFQNPQKTPSND